MPQVTMQDHDASELDALRTAQAFDAADEVHEHEDTPSHRCAFCGVCLSPLAQQDCGTCLGVAA